MSILTDQDVIDALGGDVSAADQTIVGMFRPIAERFVKLGVGYNIEQATYTAYYPQATKRIPLDGYIEGWEKTGDLVTAYSQEMDRQSLLVVDQLPLRSVTTIHENDSAQDAGTANDFTSAHLLTANQQYQVDFPDSTGISWTGFIYRIGGAWPIKPRTIKIVYVAGLSAAELANGGGFEEFRGACLVTAVALFNGFKAGQGIAGGDGGVGPVTAEKLGDWSAQYANASKQWYGGFGRKMPVGAMNMLEHRINYGRFLPINQS